MADSARTAVRSTGFAAQWVAATLLGLQDAIEGAEAETQSSGLPGADGGGPGNAYKHLLITGELYRRLGPTMGRRVAEVREFVNDVGGQTDDDADMDKINNNIVVSEGPWFETWEDVVRWARRKIDEAAAHGGDGQDGRATWYEKQPPGWRPDFEGVPVTPIEKGGPEHKFEPAKGVMTEPMGMAEAAPEKPPLDRPVAGWSEDDVRKVLNSPAYLSPQHPQHADAQARAREWFLRRFGTRRVPVDATGRVVRSTLNMTAKADACPVPVRAHRRNGGKVQVDAHCRARPAG